MSHGCMLLLNFFVPLLTCLVFFCQAHAIVKIENFSPGRGSQYIRMDHTYKVQDIIFRRIFYGLFGYAHTMNEATRGPTAHD